MGSLGFVNNQLKLNGNDFNDSQPFRNRIINGDMVINQINDSTAVTPAATAYISDQWLLNISQASKLTLQQVVDAPIGLKFSTKITVAAQYAPLVTDKFQLYQPIEGQRITNFALGTAGAVTLNTSNWIKGSVAGTYSVSIRNNTPSRSYVGTINVTTTWTKVSITLVGDTTGTWNTDTTVGMFWTIDLGSGTNFSTTTNAWQAGDFVRTAGSVTFVNQVVGSTLNITGVQLEKVPTGATQGTDFEFVPADVSMIRCQRYLLKVGVISGYAFTATEIQGFASHGRMRVIPTPSMSTTTPYGESPVSVTVRNGVASAAIGAPVSLEGGSLIRVGGFNSMTVGQSAMVSGGQVILDARL